MLAFHIFMRRSFTASTLVLGGFVAIHAQPVPSDDCAQTMTNQYAVITACQPFGMPLSFTSGSSTGSCSTLDRDAYGWFTATSDSTSITILPNNNADVGLQVFSGSCGTLNLLACIDDRGPTGLETTTIHTIIGDPYFVRVQVYTGSGADNDIPYAQLCVEETPPPPANSDPCSAINLPVTTLCNGVAAGTNISALTTVDIPNPCPAATGTSGSSGDVWFTAVVPNPQTGHMIIDTQSESEMDGAMSVYKAPGPGYCTTHNGFIYLDCDDDDSSTGNHMPQLNINTTSMSPGDTLYIRFWAFYGAEQNFRICASSGTTTLPVDFIALQAQAHNGVVEVTWSTATEQNSDHFVIERSMDNSIFEGIGEMPAAGESSNRHDYSFTDMTPPLGTVYYRVREVDHDGSSMFTSTVVAFPTASSDAPLLYPNPAVDLLNVAFTAERSGSARIEVVDALGRTLIAQQLDGERGRRSAQVDLFGLAPGYYSTRITLPSGEVLRAGGFIKR